MRARQVDGCFCVRGVSHAPVVCGPHHHHIVDSETRVCAQALTSGLGMERGERMLLHIVCVVRALAEV